MAWNKNRSQGRATPSNPLTAPAKRKNEHAQPAHSPTDPGLALCPGPPLGATFGAFTMRRAMISLAFLPVAACSPAFDVELAWTIDGEDPAAACAALPDGVDVAFDIFSRDNADRRNSNTVTETSTTAQCQDGSATIQTGPFADIIVSLRQDDVTFGASPSIAVNPGAASRNFAEDGIREDATINLILGSLTTTLTVVGRSCEDAGASSFTATLFEVPEPNALVAVDGAIDVNVSCTGGNATFTHSPINVGVPHHIQATTTIDGAAFSTASFGEGVVPTGASTFVTVDLQAE